ncbi:MAG: hypothetical protein QNK04_08525 [Myxococcota bacterium]|nr:hypothetical protein [Myxococcota bacterium]
MRLRLLVPWSFCALFLFATPAALAQPEARPLVGADLAAIGGSDFDGGIGDLLLRNDRVWAVILDPEAVTGDFGIPVTPEVLPSRGVIIDAGTVGQRNDELNEIHQILNLEGTSPVLYGQLLDIGVEGDTASITVGGIALFPAIGCTAEPTVFVTTTYAVTQGNAWIDVSTTVTNANACDLPVFQITDVDVTVNRSRIPFQPFPARGEKNPPLDFSDPFSAIGVFPFLATPGILGPEDGAVNTDQSPKEDVSYALVADSLASPLIGVANGAAVVVGNAFDLGAVGGGNIPVIPPGGTLTHVRKLVVTDRNDVESVLDVALPALDLGTRAKFSGRVVDGNGDPVADSHVFFDNVFPGADPALAGLVTLLDENRDGVADGVVPITGGEPVPSTHTITGPDGRFTVRLPALIDPTVAATVYDGSIRAENRDIQPIAPVSVDLGTLFGGPTDLGDLLVSDTGTFEFTVWGGWHRTVPATIRITGTNGTPNPEFGSQYAPGRIYTGLSTTSGDGLDPIDGGNSTELSTTVAGLPAVTTVATADGTGSVELAPGTYKVTVNRGLEWTAKTKHITVVAGTTVHKNFRIRRVVPTWGQVSMDFHVHSGRSFDTQAAPEDRVVAYSAKGVEVLVATDHDQITDYAPIISSLGIAPLINSIIGNEVTGSIPVPGNPPLWTGADFANGIGHWNAWPLRVIPGARNSGAPQSELVAPGTVIDRMLGMDSLLSFPDDASVPEWLGAIADETDEEVVMLNHPRAGLAGLTVIGLFNSLGNPTNDPAGGYDPTIPITAFPNNLLLVPSLYNEAVVGPGGTDTTGLSFDAIELMNGPGIRGYQQVREDWFSLLKQDIRKTGTAVADSHRVVLENAGFPRSYVASKTDHPALIDEDALTAAVKGMKVVGTSGPVIHFTLFDKRFRPKGLGDTAAIRRPYVLAKIAVHAAPWIPVEEVRIFRNGELIETLPVKPHLVTGGVFRLFKILLLPVEEDSFFTVEAGVSLDANGDPLSPALVAAVQEIEPDVVPLGFTNPIFVDEGADGYTPPGL